MGRYSTNEIIQLKQSRRMYKKALRRYRGKTNRRMCAYREVIIVLDVPAGAYMRRGREDSLGDASRKHRVSEALVKSFEELPDQYLYQSVFYNKDMDTLNEAYRVTRTCVSAYDKLFEYNIGKTVKPKQDFNMFEGACCTSGIHCFETKEEAMAYGWN